MRLWPDVKVRPCRRSTRSSLSLAPCTRRRRTRQRSSCSPTRCKNVATRGANSSRSSCSLGREASGSNFGSKSCSNATAPNFWATWRQSSSRGPGVEDGFSSDAAPRSTARSRLARVGYRAHAHSNGRRFAAALRTGFASHEALCESSSTPTCRPCTCSPGRPTRCRSGQLGIDGQENPNWPTFAFDLVHGRSRLS